MTGISSMFDAENINKIAESNKEEQKKLKQVQLPAGFCVLTLTKIELTKSKKDDPMFVITAKKKEDADGKYREVSEYLVISENGLKRKDGLNQNFYNLVSFFINTFKFVPKDIDNDDPLGDLTLKLAKYKGKDFRGAIIQEESLNSNKTAKFVSAKMDTRRCGHINDTTINAESVPKTVKRLSPKDAAILSGKILPDSVRAAAGKSDQHGTPTISDDDTDDLPF